MAKAKKVQTLTPEERLEQALVPENEQPYPVPDNWVWTRLHSVTYFNNGYAFKSDGYSSKGVPLVRISNIVDGGVDITECVYIDDISIDSKYHINKGDLLIAMSGATTGKNGIFEYDFTAYLNQRVGNIKIRNYQLLCEQYRNFFIELMNVDILNAAYGGAQPNISPTIIGNMNLPLPPLAEQQRIVARIESLFEKLDHARELVQSALDSFETRKAAILHKAFTGELTAQWRVENGVGMDSWEKTSINDVCTSLQYGTSKKSQSSGQIVVVRMGNLQNGEITWDDLAYANDEDDIEKYRLHIGDVLFNRTNSPELVGKTSIYNGELPAIFAGYLIRLNYKKEILMGKFLNYLLNSTDAKEYCNQVKTDGVNQSNINAKKIGAYAFALPSLPEQQEIVRILDDLLGKEQEAKDKLEPILYQIDLMKKSILARAFRGELGTNDPSEESALDLLKEVLCEGGESYE